VTGVYDSEEDCETGAPVAASNVRMRPDFIMPAGLFRQQVPRAKPARLRDLGRGVACSLLLHLLFAILVFYLLFRSAASPPRQPLHYLPIDLVQIAQQTTSPPAPRRAEAPRATVSRAARELPSTPRRPVSLSPERKLPPPDVLEIRLRQLAKLRQPDSMLPHLDNGASDEAAASAQPGADAGYRVRDFIRAQVERRWSLDLTRARDVVIMLHVVVRRDGRIDRAEIIDHTRLANDAAWRAVALSARNAVLLSSPLNFPAGYPHGRLDLVLALSPNDVVR
jgi:hypothetical protein